MKRIGILAVVAVSAVGAGFGLAGCGSKAPPGQPPTTPAASTTGATASPTGSATPSASAENLIEFTVDGAGPYQLGATLDELKAGPGLAEVTTGGATCPENTTARGTGTWSDVRLSFRKDGRLYLAVNRSTSIPTPSGAWLGTTLVDLKRIYVGIPGEQLTRGSTSAYLVVTLSGRGILFDLDAQKRVISMAAAEASFLKASYVGGTDFC